MRLGLKVLLVLAAVVAGYTALTAAILTQVVYPSFEALEREQAEEGLQRIQQAIRADLEHMRSTHKDWSEWDDTYRFVQDGNRAYVDANLGFETLQNLNLNFMLFLDRRGAPVWSGIYDLETGAELRVEALGPRGLAPGHLLLDHGNAESFVSGLMGTDRGPVLIASGPILANEGRGPIAGTLILGRFLDEAATSVLRRRVRARFSLWPLAGAPLPEAERAALAHLPRIGAIHLQERSDSILSAYTTIEDVFGQPVLLLRAETPRNISTVGADTVRYALFGLLLAGLALMAAVWVMLRRTIVGPLARLTEHVGRATRSAERFERLGLRRDDEIGALGRQFDDVLERLSTAKSRTDSILRSAGEGIYGLDVDGRITFINPAAAQMLGRPIEAMLGMPQHELLRHAGADGSPFPVEDCPILVTLEDGATRHATDDAFRRADGTGFPVDYVSAPIRERGEIIGAVVVFQDITERMAAEAALRASERDLQSRVAELERAQQKLEQQGVDLVRLAGDLRIARDEANAASQAKSEFLAAMSHELRTPLNAIIGFSEIMRDEALGPIGNVRYRGYIEDIRSSGQHLLDLINGILDLSKVESGADELFEEALDVAQVIGDVVRLLAPRAERRGIALAVDPDRSLPALRGDERKLKQILLNLLSNAIKFTEPGGRVTLSAGYRDDGEFTIRVSDTGIGIASQDVGKALSQFGQIDSDLNRRYEGTGLGLPLTKALIEAHDGALDLESELGVGTTVTLRFPAARVVAGAARGVSPARVG